MAFNIITDKAPCVIPKADDEAVLLQISILRKTWRLRSDKVRSDKGLHNRRVR